MEQIVLKVLNILNPSEDICLVDISERSGIIQIIHADDTPIGIDLAAFLKQLILVNLKDDPPDIDIYVGSETEDTVVYRSILVCVDEIISFGLYSEEHTGESNNVAYIQYVEAVDVVRRPDLKLMKNIMTGYMWFLKLLSYSSIHLVAEGLTDEDPYYIFPGCTTPDKWKGSEDLLGLYRYLAECASFEAKQYEYNCPPIPRLPVFNRRETASDPTECPPKATANWGTIDRLQRMIDDVVLELNTKFQNTLVMTCSSNVGTFERRNKPAHMLLFNEINSGPYLPRKVIRRDNSFDSVEAARQSTIRIMNVLASTPMDSPVAVRGTNSY